MHKQIRFCPRYPDRFNIVVSRVRIADKSGRINIYIYTPQLSSVWVFWLVSSFNDQVNPRKGLVKWRGIIWISPHHENRWFIWQKLNRKELTRTHNCLLSIASQIKQDAKIEDARPGSRSVPVSNTAKGPVNAAHADVHQTRADGDMTYA